MNTKVLKRNYEKHKKDLNECIETELYFKTQYKTKLSPIIIIGLIILIILSSLTIGYILSTEEVNLDVTISQDVKYHFPVVKKKVTVNNVSSEAIDYLNEILGE